MFTCFTLLYLQCMNELTHDKFLLFLFPNSTVYQRSASPLILLAKAMSFGISVTLLA